MDNFFYGIEAIMRSMSINLHSLMRYQLFWGFSIGFLVSTLVHGFLISDSPKHVPTILFRDKSTSFQKIYHNRRYKDGTYHISLHDFIRVANKIRLIFAVSFFLFAVIVLLSLLRF